MQRIPEPEIMDIPERAQAYADANFDDVNIAFLERLLELTGDRETCLALDLGTGPGEIPLRLATLRPHWQIVALDASFPMLQLAQTARREAAVPPATHFTSGDAKGTPYADNTFDLVFSNSILHHVDDPVAFWKEASRIAKPGAHVFLRDLLRPDTPQASEALVETYAGTEHPLLKEDFYNSLLAAYSCDEIKLQFAEASIDSLHIRPISDRHVDVSGTIC